jgi:hypothetical protein
MGMGGLGQSAVAPAAVPLPVAASAAANLPPDMLKQQLSEALAILRQQLAALEGEEVPEKLK